MQGSQKTVLVTGASGFVGGELVKTLVKQGVVVRALLRKTSNVDHLAGLQYERAIGDLTDYESLKKATQGVDYVIHLAAQVFAKNRQEYFHHNATGTGFIAKAVAEVNPSLKRFVYVSSLAAGGPAQTFDPKTEEDRDEPVSHYGESKLAGEIELHKYAKYPVTVVRPPIVYGPRDRAMLEFARVMKFRIAPLIPGKNSTKEKYYSAVHVQDLVDGIIRATFEVRQNQKEVFYISGDGVYTWSQIMDFIAEGLEKKPFKFRLPWVIMQGLGYTYSAIGRIVGKQFPLNIDKLNEIRPDYWICSNQKAREQLGFKPSIRLEEGLKETAKWYKTQGWV